MITVALSSCDLVSENDDLTGVISGDLVAQLEDLDFADDSYTITADD